MPEDIEDKSDEELQRQIEAIAAAGASGAGLLGALFGGLAGTQQQSQESLLNSVLRALLVVVPTYVLAALGMRWQAGQPGGMPIDGPDVPAVVAVFVVLIFTLSHGVIPVFFYAIFRGAVVAVRSATGSRWNPISLFISGFIGLHMVLWYGFPLAGLGFVNGWYTPAWAAFGVITAKRGERQWAWLEHGSTAMSLMLFQFVMSDVSLFPWGLLVVVMQSLLLTFAEWKGKPLWVSRNAALD